MIAVLDHKVPDRIPVGLCICSGVGIHATTIYRLRQALELDPPGTPVKVVEPFVMIGEIKPDLMDAIGCDVVAIPGPANAFGFRNEGWKPWTFHDGTPLLVPEKFNTDPEPDGSILMYPEGDRSSSHSGVMPMGGWYFDAVVRQPSIMEDRLKIEDNLEEHGPIPDKVIAHNSSEADRLYTETDKALLVRFSDTAFGDVGLIPGMRLKEPKGIRDIEEWYASHALRRDFIYKLFEHQCEIALQNIARVAEAVRDRVAVVHLTGTDFAGQNGLLFSPQVYRDLYKPFHKQLTDWVHKHTNWKTFIHSCGSVWDLIPDFIEAGFDILNPLQFSASNMEPQKLKRTFGDQLIFWGGGVDTQKTLPFGTPDEVKAQVKEQIRILGQDGGFIFTAVHNIQARVPTENLVGMFEMVKTAGTYPTRL
jgi:hypothetical protein